MSHNAQVDKLVAEMKDRLDKNREAQEQEKRHQLAITLRPEIALANPYQACAFWCNECLQDYSATGRKIIEGDGQRMSAVYVSDCPDGHRNYRHITDMVYDPYWSRSRNVHRDRMKHEDAMLTPHDYRFRLLYPKQWAEIERKREEAHNLHARKSTT